MKYEYQDATHVVARVFDSGREVWSQHLTLNEHGDVVDAEQYQGDEIQAHFKWDYEYDDHGNWTSRTASALIERFGERSFEPQERIERTIEYYDGEPKDQAPAKDE